VGALVLVIVGRLALGSAARKEFRLLNVLSVIVVSFSVPISLSAPVLVRSACPLPEAQSARAKSCQIVLNAGVSSGGWPGCLSIYLPLDRCFLPYAPWQIFSSLLFAVSQSK